MLVAPMLNSRRAGSTLNKSETQCDFDAAIMYDARMAYLCGDAVERVDVRSATEQSLPQDEREHDPDEGNELQQHHQQEERHVADLRRATPRFDRVLQQ